MKSHLLVSRAVALLACSVAPALAQDREDVLFQISHDLSGQPNWSVFVQGDLPELGGLDVRESVKLQSADGIDWWVTISLPVNTTYTYRFIARIYTQSQIGNQSNWERVTGWASGSTSNVALEPPRKTIQALTTFDAPWLHWRYADETHFRHVPMLAFGPGRTAGEARWIVPWLAAPRRTVVFYLTSADGTQRDPADGSNYRTALDQALVQDGALYSYVPDGAVSAPRRDYDPASPPGLFSSVLGAERFYRVWLPRGYDDHPDRRYPVLYQYDGQVLWDAGDVSWDLDGKRMGKLVDRSLAGEVIQVGIDFLTVGGCNIDENRFKDCASPEDSWNAGCGPVNGEGDLFQAFLSQELKPLIDSTYRTVPDRGHTFAQGYSFGGIFALYAGWENNDTFGAVGPQSGSFWVPNFPARVKSEPKKDLRVYLDTGDNELTIYNSVLSLRDNLVGKIVPYVEEGDLRYEVALGHSHSWSNGGKRLRRLMTFLYPGTAEVAEFFVGDRYCDAVAHSGGKPAMLYAEGSTEAAADDLTLTAIRVPRGEFGLFFVGTASANLPGFGGGAGVQCAGGTLTRFGAVQATAGGVLRDAPSFAGLAVPGQTLYVQAWFRDGATSNTSDAVAITFE